jgi:hypothetical protein
LKATHFCGGLPYNLARSLPKTVKSGERHNILCSNDLNKFRRFVEMSKLPESGTKYYIVSLQGATISMRTPRISMLLK